jgi:hypothetical protein
MNSGHVTFSSDLARSVESRHYENVEDSSETRSGFRARPSIYTPPGGPLRTALGCMSGSRGLGEQSTQHIYKLNVGGRLVVQPMQRVLMRQRGFTQQLLDQVLLPARKTESGGSMHGVKHLLSYKLADVDLLSVGRGRIASNSHRQQSAQTRVSIMTHERMQDSRKAIHKDKSGCENESVDFKSRTLARQSAWPSSQSPVDV